jgi:hypothetical protein
MRIGAALMERGGTITALGIVEVPGGDAAVRGRDSRATGARRCSSGCSSCRAAGVESQHDRAHRDGVLPRASSSSRAEEEADS